MGACGRRQAAPACGASARRQQALSTDPRPLGACPPDRSGKGVAATAEPKEGRRLSMDALLRLSEGLRRLLEVIALTSGWLLVVMACVTTFDVLARKAGLQLPFTKLQELEWHFHAAIFSLWMGYCYTINVYPRVASFTENLSYRGR